MHPAQVARIFAASGVVFAFAAACASFSSSSDAPSGDDAGSDAEAGEPPAPPALDSCDLPDASAPAPTSCGDTTSSDSNCGFCGHVCGTSTPCKDGLCTPEPVGNNPTTRLIGLVDGMIYGQQGPTTIVRRPADGSGSGDIIASYEDSGASITAAAARTDGIVVGAYPLRVDLLTLDGALVGSVPNSGYEVGIATPAPNAYFFAGVTGTRVQYATRDAGVDGSLLTYFDEGPGRVVELVVDEDELFLANDPTYPATDGGDGGDGRIVKKTFDGGNVVHSAPLGEPRAIAVYGGTVYWYEAWDRTIRAAPRAALDSPPKTIASLADTPGLPSEAVFVQGFAVDDANVYAFLSRSPDDAYLVQASRCGHGNVPPHVVAHTTGADGLALDATHVYWGDIGGLVRLAK